jgi:predicted nucleic acid-binding protein
MPLLVDTGVLYALADRRDAWHARVRAYLRDHPDTLLAPVTILPEVTYLLRDRIGSHAELAFVRAVANGEVAVEAVQRRDLSRALELMDTYDDLGFVGRPGASASRDRASCRAASGTRLRGRRARIAALPGPARR